MSLRYNKLADVTICAYMRLQHASIQQENLEDMACFTPDELKLLPPETQILEIGCGQRPVWAQSKTLDINPASKATVIHDLSEFPYPFEDNTFDYVVAEHVLEHLRPVLPVLDELHRIIKPTGQLRIEVPHYTSFHYWTDPTHQTPFGIGTLDYIVPIPSGGGVYQFHYSKFDWRKISVQLNGPMHNWFHRALTRYFNAHQSGYEMRIAPLFQRDSINFVIQPIK